MSFSPELLGRLSILLFGLFSCWLFFVPFRMDELPEQKFKRFIVLFWLVSRIGIFLLFYVVLNWSVEGDVMGYYYPQGKAVVEGGTIYRDFISSYAPLFPYLVGALISIVDSPKTIVFFSILVEGFSLFFWIGYARILKTTTAVRRAVLLYITCPLILMNVAFNGQNQIWIAFFLGLSVYLLVRKYAFWSGLIYSGSIVLVKFLALLFTPCLFFLAKARIKWALGFGSLPLLVYGYCYSQGLDVLAPFKAESLLTSAGNIPFLVTSILGLRNGLTAESGLVQFIFYLVLISFFLGLIFLILKDRLLNDPKQFAIVLTCFFALFMLWSNKSQTNYLMTCLFPICLALATPDLSNKKVFFFALFSAVAIIEPSFWYRVHFLSLDMLWMPGVILKDRLNVLIILLLDCYLIGFYGYLLWLCWRNLYPKPVGKMQKAFN